MIARRKKNMPGLASGHDLNSVELRLAFRTYA